MKTTNKRRTHGVLTAARDLASRLNSEQSASAQYYFSDPDDDAPVMRECRVNMEALCAGLLWSQRANKDVGLVATFLAEMFGDLEFTELVAMGDMDTAAHLALVSRIDTYMESAGLTMMVGDRDAV
ncbi:MAG: hypothetical protein V9F04_04525 [Dermatophilaceae bacterium]